MEQVAAAAANAVNESDLMNALPRSQMLRPVKSAESLSTASVNHPTQRTQSDRLSSTASKPGAAAILLASSVRTNTTATAYASSTKDNKRDCDQLPVLRKDSSQKNNVSENARKSNRASKMIIEDSGSRPMSMDLDEVGELEKVCQAVNNIKNNSKNSHSRTSSPKCHSRSSSHDSYFERKLASSVVQFKMDDEDNDSPESPDKNMEKKSHFDNASLDLSEIQVNFELEENEMKIFSEDEAMLSNSCGSDLSKSLFGNSIFEDDLPNNKVHGGKGNDTCLVTSPKGQRMSFREKFKRFTSPNSGRKTEHVDGNDGLENNGSKKPTMKEKVFGTLSPESLRKCNQIASHHSVCALSKKA